MRREFDWLDNLVDGLRWEYGAPGGDGVFRRVHVLPFVLKERDCSLHHHPERAVPLRTKGTRPCPRRRAAEHQQLSDSRRKDVSPVGARLRGATRGAGAGGMNRTEITSVDANIGYPLVALWTTVDTGTGHVEVEIDSPIVDEAKQP